MSVIPYLTFRGTCFEAMSFYAKVFDTEIDTIMRAGEMPDYPVPDDKKDLIAHMNIKFAGGEIYASDAIMGEGSPMAGCSVMVALPEKDAAEAAFNQLADGGTMTMPFQAMFWAAGFGTLIDRYGIHWMISTET